MTCSAYRHHWAAVVRLLPPQPAAVAASPAYSPSQTQNPTPKPRTTTGGSNMSRLGKGIFICWLLKVVVTAKRSLQILQIINGGGGKGIWEKILVVNVIMLQHSHILYRYEISVSWIFPTALQMFFLSGRQLIAYLYCVYIKPTAPGSSLDPYLHYFAGSALRRKGGLLGPDPGGKKWTF